MVKILQVGAKVGKITKNFQNEQDLRFLKFDFKPHNFRYNHFSPLKFGAIVTCNVSKKMVAKNYKIATNSCDEVTNYVKIMQKTIKNTFLNYLLQKLEQWFSCFFRL